MTPTILITRPDPANTQFADRIRVRLGCGFPIVMSPLMRIEFCGEVPDLTPIRTLLFTSRNGVLSFVHVSERRDIPCYCVGDATAQLAADHGLLATSCGGAAGDLMARVLADNPTGPCLQVRGEHTVGDIAGRLSSAGLQTQEMIGYRQVSQPLSEQANELLRGENPVILPLFSPRTASLLPETVGVRAEVRVAAISENVASAVPDGFARTVLVAKRPDAEAVLDAVQALVDPGKALEGGILAQ